MAYCPVLPVREKSGPKDPEPPPFLGKLPAVFILLGPPGAGKSTWLANFLLRTQGYFTGGTLIMSPTVLHDPSMTPVVEMADPDRELDVSIMPSYDETALEAFRDVLVAREEEGDARRHPTLLVIDDLVGVLPKNGGVVGNLCTRHRHYGLTIVLATQKWRELSTLVRTNASRMIFLSITGEEEGAVRQACFWEEVPSVLRAAKILHGRQHLDCDCRTLEVRATDGFSTLEEDVVYPPSKATSEKAQRILREAARIQERTRDRRDRT